MVIGKYNITWIRWSMRGCGLYDSGSRLNGGGYMYGASPYSYWRFGRIMIKRFWSK